MNLGLALETALAGAIVGLSLGLTGGGGALLAVPLLVFGLGVHPRQAVSISLAAVGAMAAVGAIQRLARQQVEVVPALIFSLGGLLGAPVGTWIARQIPEGLLLVLFAILMTVVALRMWRGARQAYQSQELPLASVRPQPEAASCQRDPAGRLRLVPPCAVVLTLLGVTTGVLAGLFGVGGGFIIVPALVLFTGMELRRAVGTSLLVIALISAFSIVSRRLSGFHLPWEVMSWFVIGGVGGLTVGGWLADRLAGPRLQQTFAGVLLGVAGLMLLRPLWQ
jgi:uncharacterized membrane protein YfcA